MLNDHELKDSLVSSMDASAPLAGYGMIRLPLEVAGLFKTWLRLHNPLKAVRSMNRIRDLLNLLRQGRGVPSVPLILVGVVD